ncbi:MAG: SpoIVB peptidase [Lachnospiraceae bacterium]
MNSKKYIWQKWIGKISIIGGFFLLFVFSGYLMEKSIPDKIWIVEGKEENFDFHVPMTGIVESNGLEVFGNQSDQLKENNLHLNLNESFSLKSEEAGDFHLACRLFGMFHMKEVEVEVVKEEQVVPCGIPIGIYVQTDGVLIIGTGAVTGIDGMNYEPGANLVKSGDYIKTVNEQVIETKENLIDAVNKCNGEPVILGIQRNQEYIKLKVNSVCTGENEYKLGIWVRDDLAGVGTLTFYNKEGIYGALGHPVSDMDTGTQINMGEGTLYEAQVAGITKGEKGKPGEVTGIITYLDQYKLGTVGKNTKVGIFGNLTHIPETVSELQSYPIGLKQEVQEGPGTLISYLSGERVEYAIEITGLDYNSSSENKGIMFQVTDPKLLELTGGIIQGMSGSPIIQNGKIIGAVTHVFIQDAAKGYGVFLEKMMQQEKE